MTDAELLARFVSLSDQAAFAEIVSRHAGLVVGAARRLAPLDADDVAQATFILLARRASRLTNRSSLAGWLYVTATHCARNARRSRRRHERKLATRAAREPASTRSTTANADLSALLDAALARLPSATRDVVLLRHVESLSVAETAERLGVPATTVTKRSERGLSKLRDFFAARGHASLATAGVAALLARPTAPVDAATLATAAAGRPSPGVAALVASPTVPVLAVTAAAAAVAILTAAVVAVRPQGSPPAIAATAPAATAPAANSPASRPLPTQESGRAAATAFLDALRRRDRATLDAFWADGSPADREAKSTALIARVIDGAYARYPQRLTLGGNGWFQMEPTIFEADGTRRPSSPGGPRLVAASLEAMTPTEADIGRLVLRLGVTEDEWKVALAEFVADGATDVGTRVDLADADAISPAVAARAEAAWQRAEAAFEGVNFSATLEQKDVPAFRDAITKHRAALAEFIAALAGSPVAIADSDARRVDALWRESIDLIDGRPLEELRQRMDSAGSDAALQESLFHMRAAADRAAAMLDAEEERHPPTTRPAPVGPRVPVRLAWKNGETVWLRGPLVFPEWLRSTRAYKRWEGPRDIRTFRTRDDSGDTYEVAISGAARSPDGGVVPMVRSIRRYRPDGTLAAIAEYGAGTWADTWGEFDETGRRYTFRVQSRSSRTENPDGIDWVRFYDADGSIRDWYTSGDAENRVWWDRTFDPIGEHMLTLHLVHRDGTDDGDPNDDMPIDDLPIERD